MDRAIRLAPHAAPGRTGGAGMAMQVDAQVDTRTDRPVERVTATMAALQLIAELRGRHGPVMFFQSGGCCDGSAPMCYPAGEFSISDSDVYLGNLDGAPFYIGRDQFDYWQHTQLVIDVVPGNGGMFSLDNGSGRRFLLRSRLFSDAENARLQGLQGLHGLAIDPPHE